MGLLRHGGADLLDIVAKYSLSSRRGLRAFEGEDEPTPKLRTSSGRIETVSHGLLDAAEVHEENVSLWTALSSAHKEKYVHCTSAIVVP